MSKHTPGKLTVDSANMFLFGRCIGGVQMKDDSFMVAEIRGWGHLQYRDDGADRQKANIHRLADCWNSHDQLVKALKKSYVPHNRCEDTRYSCPRSEEGAGEFSPTPGECDCGAKDHNARIDNALKARGEEE